jgi:hypothetical protein
MWGFLLVGKHTVKNKRIIEVPTRQQTQKYNQAKYLTKTRQPRGLTTLLNNKVNK